MEDENAYGIKKRFDYICNILKKDKPKTVLDIGCGTGDFLTAPLAKAFPQTVFFGVDSDRDTISHAKKNHNYDNLIFFFTEEKHFDDIDLIIASEVIEHVDNPKKFLSLWRNTLSSTGKMIITVPNGYGPFELVNFIFDSIKFICKKNPFIENNRKGVEQDTLSISPHVNFFSCHQLHNIFSSAKFKVCHYQPRTFLCGFPLDWIIHKLKLCIWNAKITEKLPTFFASDWMFYLEKTEQGENYFYTRNRYAKLRRYINLKNCGLQ